MNEYNVEFLNYKIFSDKYSDKILSSDKTQIETINNDCLNKNFFYILLWEKWIEENDTVIYYNYEISSTQEKYKLKNTKTSFNDLNLFPYETNSNDIFPIIDIRKIFRALNFGDTNKILDFYYDFIFSKLETEKIKERLDYYIDQDYTNMQKANYGLYFDILSILELDSNDYIAQLELKNNKEIKYPDFYDKELLKFKEKSKLSFNDKLDFIKNYNYINMTEIQQYEILNKLDGMAKIIIKTILVILTYTENIYKKLLNNSKNENTELTDTNLRKLFNITSQSTIPIDRILEIVKPSIKPLFKKSYIVKENNLFGYIKIKMIKNIKNVKDEYLEIDNFNIPYNQILSFEYNVLEQTAVLSLIDTDGNLSELLINKMYSFFNSNSKYIKEKNQNETAEYFEIEYGWSGPETENIVELLNERIFIKKTFRGYIKAIASQFTQNGTQYDIKISPTNFLPNISINSFNLFYKIQTMEYTSTNTWIGYKETSFSFILIFYYIILKNFNKELINDSNFKSIFQTVYYNKNAIFLEKIFFILLSKDFYISPIISKKEVIGYKILAITEGDVENENKYLIEMATINNTDNNDDFQLINQLIEINELTIKKNSFLNNKKIKTEISFYDVHDMKTISDDMLKILNNEKYSLNAWLVGVILILMIKFYYLRYEKQIFIFHDTTGIFNFFTPIFNPSESNSINISEMITTIRKIKPFGNKQIPSSSSLEEELLLNIEQSFSNNRNKYKLSRILNYFVDEIKKENVNNLTFFTARISEIFNSIKNLDGKYNTNLKLSNGLKASFSTFDAIKIETFKETYKEIIYSSKNSIIENSTQDNNPEEINYNRLSENLNKVAQKLVKPTSREHQINILYLTYNLDLAKFFNSEYTTIEEKVKIFSKMIAQSYSLTPRINPKTRNSNKQFFSQGNDKLLKEGTGDIIEFEIKKMDIENVVLLTTMNKNQKNIGFTGFTSHTFMNGIYENAAKYYNTYTDINGEPDKLKIAKDIATLQANYRDNIQLEGSITIFGEPYWSDINLLKNKYIYLNIYYSNGTKSSHSGLYMVKNSIHFIINGKYTTKLEIIRQNTFLSNFSIKGEKNTYLV